MTRKTFTRAAAGLAGVLAALTVATATAGPAAAYIAACGDPVTVQTEVTYRNGKPVTTTVTYDARTGKKVTKFTKKQILTPNAAATEGVFTIPVPAQFRGKATKVTVQFVTDSGTPATWMERDKTLRTWGGGWQVWKTKTVTAGKTVTVAVPNYDTVGFANFKFEVVFTAKKVGTANYLVAPTDVLGFNAYEQDSNGFTALTVR